MEKCYGTEERHDQLIVLGTGQCVLIYGHGEEDGQGFDYRHRFDHRPTAAELLEVINDHVDSLTDQKILTGYRWQGKNVKLSSENQFNFKAAYDLAVQKDGKTLPVKFKLGNDADGLPVYHTFNSMNAFADFYTGATNFILQTLAAGWVEKDAARDWVNQLYNNE